MKHRGASASYDRDEILRKAETYRSQRRFRKAIQKYEEILSVDPRDTDVHIRAAPLYIRAGRKEQAKRSLRVAIAWYEKKGFVEKAIAMLRLVLTVDRRDLAAYLHLSDLYRDRGHPGDAVSLLAGARKVFRGRKFLNEALKVEERILTLAPDDFRVQLSLVRLLWIAGKRREALGRLRHMEEEWSRRGNRKHWRKTRRYLFRLTPSLSTGWGYFLSLFTSPVPYRHAGGR